MNSFATLKCINCGKPGPIDNMFDGCPSCKANGYPSNYTTTFNYSTLKKKISNNWPLNGKGLWKYKQLMPVSEKTKPVSMAEGDTPLLHLERFGECLDLEKLYIKDETRNPTWSYKDRLCSVAVTRGIEVGAKVITIASTGNHGASAAAYAAKASIPCVIFTTPQVPQTMKTLMQVYGAYVVATPTPADRWKIMKQCVKKLNWYPVSGYVEPPIGSNPFGVDGYKTISYEIIEQLGNVPDFVAVPAAYSDGLYGIWKGMKELKLLGVTARLPKMIASEVFGSLTNTLALQRSIPLPAEAVESTVSFSIASRLGTYQGLIALKESAGLANTSSDLETMNMQKLLASTEGIYAEASSVTSLVVIAKLRKKGLINAQDTVVAVLTSSGLKDPLSTARLLENVPVVEPELDVLFNKLNAMGYTGSLKI